MGKLRIMQASGAKAWRLTSEDHGVNSFRERPKAKGVAMALPQDPGLWSHLIAILTVILPVIPPVLATFMDARRKNRCVRKPTTRRPRLTKKPGGRRR